MSQPGNLVDVTAYPRLQDALDALPPHGGTLYVPAGRHEVHEPVTLALEEGQHLSLIGEGRASVLVNMRRDGAPLLHITGVVGSWWPDLKITLRDLTLVGNPDSGDGVVAEYPNDTLIDACFFCGHGGRALYLGPHGTNVTVRDCWMRDCKRGVRADNIHHLTLHGNQTRSMKDGQVQAEHLYLDANCREVRVVNNHFAYGHAEGIILDGTAQQVLANNTIEGFTVGIEARGVSRDMVISANYIHSPVAVRLRGQCDGFVIADNTMINCGEGAVQMVEAAGAGGHAITGNVCRRSVYQGLRGFDLGEAESCVVQGNVFDGIEGEPVTAQSDTHVIVGNVVRRGK